MSQLDNEVAERVAQELPRHIKSERHALRLKQQNLNRQIKHQQDLIFRWKIALALTGIVCLFLMSAAGWHNHQAKKYASERRIALKAAQSAQKAAEAKTASQYTKQPSEYSQNAENASSGPSEQEIQAIKNEIKTAYNDSLATGDNAEARQAAVKAKQQQIIADYDKIKDHLNVSDSFTYWMYVNQIKALS